MLERLFSSNLRIQLLTVFLSNPDSRSYPRELEREVNQNSANIVRELRNLERLGLLVSEREGNIKYYSVNKDFFLYPELKSIIFKTTGVQGALQGVLKDLEGVKFAFIYGSYAKGTEGKDSDVDLMVIGEVDMDKLHEIVSELEDKLKREINYTVFGEDEFERRKAEGEPFVSRVLHEKKIMVIGDESDL